MNKKKTKTKVAKAPTIKIGFKKYKMLISESLINKIDSEYPEDSSVGRCDYKKAELVIRPSEIDDEEDLNELKCTILHEVSHAFFANYTGYKLSNDEDFIESFSNQLLTLIVENKFLFKFILDESIPKAKSFLRQFDYEEK
jgi:hypothetical protein